MITLTIIKYRILIWLYIRIGNILTSMEVSMPFNINVIEKRIGAYYNAQGYTKTKSRKRKYVISRQVLATVLRNNTNMTLDEIGSRMCDGQNHENIIHSLKSIDMLIETNKQFKHDFFRLMRKLSTKYEKYHYSGYVKIKLIA